MKRAIAGILFGMAFLCLPVRTCAHERQCPKTIEVTQDEAVELMQIASAEALNQGPDGMRFVMSCVINRVNSPDFPDTIHKVIHQPHQFATSGMAKAEITPEVHQALAELECGNLALEIVAFEKSSNDSLDAFFTEAFTFRDHVFYTEKIN